MTHAAAARLAGVSRRTIYRWCEAGHLRERHYGRWKRVLAEDVEAIVAAGFRSPKHLHRRYSKENFVTVIKPTVGRMILYKPAATDHMSPDASGYCAATVAFVHSDTMVNLCVFAGNGHPTPRTNVLLVQQEQPAPPGGGYCQWMEYQLEQAARAEAAEMASAAK